MCTGKTSFRAENRVAKKTVFEHQFRKIKRELQTLLYATHRYSAPMDDVDFNFFDDSEQNLGS